MLLSCLQATFTLPGISVSALRDALHSGHGMTVPQFMAIHELTRSIGDAPLEIDINKYSGDLIGRNYQKIMNIDLESQHCTQG